MPDNARIQDLLESILESPQPPEEACRDCPELLPAVKRRLEQLRALDGQLANLFPSTPSGASPATPDAQSPGASRQPGKVEYAFLSPPQLAGELGRLGNYRVLEELGSGGMGTVFLAEDVHLKRRVALKVIKPELAASPTARLRFRREAQATAALKAEHIVTVYQAGEDRGVLFLAVELLQGQTLAARLRGGGKLAPAEALRIGKEIAQGLASAHAAGLIHRDIKPGNIFLEELPASDLAATTGQTDGPAVALDKASGPGPRVKILDFGLARLTWSAPGAEEMPSTQPGLIAGTPGFMAPEQARGDGVDARSDLFSLGCVLYRACTGTDAFAGAHALAVLRALELHSPAPARSRNPELPAALSDLIDQLLAKDPDGRPTSAHAVAGALEAIQAVDGAAPRNGTVAEAPGTRRAKRGPSRALRRVALSLALLGVLAWTAFWYGPSLFRVATARGDDRKAAEWVLSMGGSVKILSGPEPMEIEPGKDLPAEKWQLDGVDLSNNTNDIDAGLQNLRNVPNLAWLRLNKSSITDAGLKHLEVLTSLRELDLGGTQVSDEGLAHLCGLTGLRLLRLHDSPNITDKGLVHLQNLTNLNYLALPSPVSDRGVEHLQGLTNLKELVLTRTQVSNAGLAHLRGMKTLTTLWLNITPVTDAGLEHLNALTSLRDLHLSNTQVTGAGLRNLRDLKSLTGLHLWETKVTDAQLQHLSLFPNLVYLNLGRTNISDDGLRALRVLPRLNHLNLEDTKITDAGLEKLGALTTLRRLDMTNTRVTEAKAEAFRAKHKCDVQR
jgi:hypothetical protein